MKQVKSIYPGQSGRGIMPHSEVCMHMRIAGQPMYFRLLESGRAVQLYDSNDQTREFSAPILPGEAGLYWDDSKRSYYYYAE